MVEIPDAFRGRLRVGTCSWKYDSWRGLLYDRDTKYHADDYLVDYSKHLDTVEVDQWFWSLYPAGPKLPDRTQVTTYARSVPEDFVFAVKAPNSITLTHFYAKQPKSYAKYANAPNPHFLSVELLERFLESLQPMRSRLGPIMFQFEYLNRKKIPSREAFLERMDAFFSGAPRGYRYAVETRNPNYLSEAYFEFLRERNLGHVFVDGYYMPAIGEAFHKYDTRTADFCVIRLLGTDRAGMEDTTGGVWNRLVEQRDEGIRTAVEIVKANADRMITTYVMVNNHYEGSAPLTVERFLAALAKAE
jgi:uncharacterized protein YecE (DUF72 family)